MENRYPMRGLRLLPLLMAVLLPLLTKAQVASYYSFSQSSGTFSLITGGSVLSSGTFDNTVHTVNLANPGVIFNGTVYNTMYVSTNGFITFGAAAAATNYTPLSSTATYAGAISAFGARLENATSGTREVRVQRIGEELIVQWRDVRRQGVTGGERFSMQVRMNTTDGTLRVIYGGVNSQGSGTDHQPQVGLRGASNAFATNVNNRLVTTGSNNWATSLSGTANSSTCRFTSTSPARAFTNGLTYTWEPCTAPSATVTVGSTDCVNNTFSATVNVTSLGNAANVSLVANPGGTVLSNVGVGSHTVDLPLGTVALTLTHNGNNNCNVSLGNVANTMSCVVNGQCYGSTALPQIPDNGCGANNYYEVGIPISGLPNNLSNAPLGTLLESVDLMVAHTYRGDLRIHLVSPQGQQRDLFLRKPSTNAGGDNLGNPSNCPSGALKLRDGAAALTTMSSSSNNVTGTFAPEQTLAGFTGNPNGTWILRICDAAAQDVGRLRHVQLNFAQNDCAGNLGGAALPGATCNDGDVCTTGDVYDNNCNCTGTLQDSDGDGVCDANDGCPFDANKTAPGACGCGVADVPTTWYADVDGDGFGDPNTGIAGFTCIQPNGHVADNSDLCPNDINKVAPGACGCGTPDVAVTWYADTDGDGFGDPNTGISGYTCDQPTGYVANSGDLCPDDANKQAPGQCGCGTADIDTDGDGIADCVDACPNDPFNDADGDGICGDVDSCPNAFGQVGSPCNAGPGFILGTLDANCNCVGVACTDNVTLEFTTDDAPSDLSWQLVDVLTNTTIYQGQGFMMPPTAVFQWQYCLPADRCYKLLVSDNGNGTTGNPGYELRHTATQRRIIDARGGFTFNGTSQIANGYSFCLGMGTDEPMYTSTDKAWWRTGEYLVAQENPAVSAAWSAHGPTADSGYEFWFFDPHGSYNFRRFRAHNQSDGFANVGATRACHMKVNNWAAANHIPEHTRLNVRIRGRVSGTNMPWGPASVFVRNEALAQNPPTKLMDIPGNQFISCGQFRQFVSNQRIHARPVSGANLYQWRFRIEAENVEIVRTSTTYFLNLGWSASVAAPLQNSKTYEVDVRASRDGGATWGGYDSDPWGDVCLLTIGTPPAMGGNQNMSLSADGVLAMWPNPNTGDLLWISLSEVAQDVESIAVDIHDLVGQRIMTRMLPVQSHNVNTPLELPGNLATGVYTVTIVAGTTRHTQRLVIQR
ncbi:MAG: proprotein convertase P-domain-containing protein [Flavobacteriales bacterium]|nr:proprotein convertase P-domain-containing protein [Flavobacteriales bacterium]